MLFFLIFFQVYWVEPFSKHVSFEHWKSPKCLTRWPGNGRSQTHSSFSFLLPWLSGCCVTAKWGQLACRTRFLGASHYQPNHTQREGIAQRDRLRWQWQPFLSTQPHVLCQEVIQLAASTSSFLSKPTLRQRLWSRVLDIRLLLSLPSNPRVVGRCHAYLTG